MRNGKEDWSSKVKFIQEELDLINDTLNPILTLNNLLIDKLEQYELTKEFKKASDAAN